MLSCALVLSQSSAGEHKLAVEEAVKLGNAQFSEDIVITKTKENGTPFDPTIEELMGLKKEGVIDNILKYLLDPSLP